MWVWALGWRLFGLTRKTKKLVSTTSKSAPAGAASPWVMTNYWAGGLVLFGVYLVAAFLPNVHARSITLRDGLLLNSPSRNAHFATRILQRAFCNAHFATSTLQRASRNALQWRIRGKEGGGGRGTERSCVPRLAAHCALGECSERRTKAWQGKHSSEHCDGE